MDNAIDPTKPAKASESSGKDEFQLGARGWLVKFVGETSPLIKMFLFFLVGGLFLIYTQLYILLWIIIGFYLLFYLPVLIFFKPDRTWSEPTMLEWFRLGLSDKDSKKISDVQEGEIVQPLVIETDIHTKANISDPSPDERKVVSVK